MTIGHEIDPAQCAEMAWSINSVSLSTEAADLLAFFILRAIKVRACQQYQENEQKYFIWSSFLTLLRKDKKVQLNFFPILRFLTVHAQAVLGQMCKWPFFKSLSRPSVSPIHNYVFSPNTREIPFQKGSLNNLWELRTELYHIIGQGISSRGKRKFLCSLDGNPTAFTHWFIKKMY